MSFWKKDENKIGSKNNNRYVQSHNHGEGVIIHSTRNGEIILENTILKKEIMIKNKDNKLMNLQESDIDFIRVSKLDNPENARRYVAEYGYGIEAFRNGVALVWWTLYPDGRYFADEDGFGAENCNETTVYAYIDTLGKVVIPFRDMNSEEIEKFRKEAEVNINN
ncbi:MAG: hypothetical protein K0R34_968 [Herbinix sp.]|jgi:hypothetical protein|nr:hypothetical protein [Herbinix sp.]